MLDRPQWLPSEEQELLLQAALLSPNRAIKAWQRWKSLTSIYQIQLDTSRILPLVWRNLHQHLADPEMGILKGLYRSTWCKNQIRINNISPVLEALSKQSIRFSFLKGTSLTLEYYKDFGLRPMADIDLIIQEKDLIKAEHILNSLSWFKDKNVDLTELAITSHGVAFTKPNCKDLDLHWRLSWDFPCNYTNQIWERTKYYDFQDLVIESLDSTDFLFHTCIHGSRIGYRNTFNSQPRVIHWIPDAIEVTKCAKINWEQLIETCSLTYTRPQLFAALSYLESSYQAQVPDWALLSLSRKPIGRAEKFRYQAAMHPHPAKFFSRLIYLWRLSSAQVATEEGLEYLDQITPSQRLSALARCLRKRFATDHLPTALYRAVKLFFV